ncbi:MAG TPA: hypothetical protein VLM36_01480 [Sphingomicrobium sp.]|nr:hypothetical protein [Sphingomicrobium sp.]
MASWKSIRLELGSSDEFPGGSVSRGYLIRLPLDDQGMVDRTAFRHHPHRAKVRRYWSTEPDEAGEVIEKEGSWALRCDGDPNRILQLYGQPLRVGDQLSVIERDGTVLTFEVASIA